MTYVPPTVAELEQHLTMLAEICEICPEAIDLFDRCDAMLEEARAQAQDDPIARIRARRAAHSIAGLSAG